MNRDIIFILVLLVLFSCKEPFPTESIEFEKVLIIEGQITNENIPHEIKVGYSSPIDSLFTSPVSNAIVKVIENQKNEYQAVEMSPGIYRTPSFSGIAGNTYQLFVETSNGDSYSSTMVTQKEVNPIDTVIAEFWINDLNLKGVFVSVSAGTSSFSSNDFYRWTYSETYEIVTPFPSLFRWEGGNEVLVREQQVGNCWVTSSNSQIFVKNVQNIEGGEVSSFSIKFIENEAPELRVKYSILVRQFSLDFTGYNFWRTLNEIATKQGSFADIQPGNAVGNISSADGLPVLGYFDASDVSTMRIFITPGQFEKEGFVVSDIRESCPQTFIPGDEVGDYFRTRARTHVIFNEVDAGAFGDDNPAGFTAVRKPCGDCTDSGLNIRPSFWE